MSQLEIVRAWKDPGYRRSLNAQQLATLPPNPAGAVEAGDEDLTSIGWTGITGFSHCICTTSIICPFVHESGGDS
jgi:mersacidin/lichenicidin family type 2 lantibiotic